MHPAMAAHPSMAGRPYDALLDGPPPPPEPPSTAHPRVIVTGSQAWRHAAPVRVALCHAWRAAGQPIVVVHGGSDTGTDAIAADWVREHAFCGITAEAHPTDWHTHGRAAEQARNQRLVDRGAFRVLAFPAIAEPSPGTKDCVRRALAAGLDVRYPATVPPRDTPTNGSACAGRLPSRETQDTRPANHPDPGCEVHDLRVPDTPDSSLPTSDTGSCPHRERFDTLADAEAELVARRARATLAGSPPSNRHTAYACRRCGGAHITRHVEPSGAGA